MKKIKLLLWIIVLTILDASVMKHMRIFNAVPILTYSFLICVAILDDEFTVTAIAGGICGIIGGSLFGQDFYFTFIFYALSAVAVFYLKSRPRHMHKIFKVLFWCGVFSFIWGIGTQLIAVRTITLRMMYSSIIAGTVYNMAASAAVYPILERTVYRSEMKRVLINK